MLSSFHNARYLLGQPVFVHCHLGTGYFGIIREIRQEGIILEPLWARDQSESRQFGVGRFLIPFLVILALTPLLFAGSGYGPPGYGPPGYGLPGNGYPGYGYPGYGYPGYGYPGNSYSAYGNLGDGNPAYGYPLAEGNMAQETAVPPNSQVPSQLEGA